MDTAKSCLINMKNYISLSLPVVKMDPHEMANYYPCKSVRWLNIRTRRPYSSLSGPEYSSDTPMKSAQHMAPHQSDARETEYAKADQHICVPGAIGK